MNQDALAEKVAVSRSQISQWENGRSQPHPGNMHMLAEALRTTAEAFYRTPGSETGRVDPERVAYLASRLTTLEARAPGVISSAITVVDSILAAWETRGPSPRVDLARLYASLSDCLTTLTPGSDAWRAVRTALDEMQPPVETARPPALRQLA